jgi:hypothetical protein
MNLLKKIKIVMILLLLTAGTLVAQTRISSPYSRYGIGDLQNTRYLRNLSMGGLSYAFRNSNAVNYSNPASYTCFDSTSYVFETGINSQFMKTQTTETSQNSNYTSLGYLVMGFPVTKWWGASIGLLPYSNVGYKISDTDSFPVTGQVKYKYEGSGGLNQFYAGNAFKISKNLSVGFNTSFIFGYLDKTRTVSSDSSYFLNLRMKNEIIVNDFLFNYGLQYTKKLKDNLSLSLGLVFNNSTNLTAKQDSFAVTYLLGSLDNETNKDTLINSNGYKGQVLIPQNIGLGFCLEQKGRWMAGADVSMQNWKKFSSFGEKDSLKNSIQASVGFEFTPKSSPISGYWKKVHYRVGARYNKTYLQLRDNQLTEYAASFGFGLPLKKSKTAINLGFELGKRGTTENNLIQENFGRVILSLSIYERWFIKKKFD